MTKIEAQTPFYPTLGQIRQVLPGWAFVYAKWDDGTMACKGLREDTVFDMLDNYEVLKIFPKINEAGQYEKCFDIILKCYKRGN